MSYTAEQKAELERLIAEGKFELAKAKARVYLQQNQQQSN